MTASIPTVPLPRNSDQTDEVTQLEVNIRLMTGLLALSCLIFTVFLLGLAFYRMDPRPLIVAAVTLIGAVVIGQLRNRSIQATPEVRLFISDGIFLTATTLFALIFADIALQSVSVMILIALMSASTGIKGARVDVVISMGIIAAVVTSLINIFIPFERLAEPYVIYGINIYLFLMAGNYLLMYLGNRIGAGLRIKIILPALAIVIVPLVLLNLVDTLFLRTSIQEQTNQSLLNAATTLSRDVDTFIIAQRSSVASQALLPTYADFLNTSDAFRKPGSSAAKQVSSAVESYKSGMNVKDRVYLASFALLDMEGRVVYSSNEKELGSMENNRIFFSRPAVRGSTYYSPVEFSDNGKIPLMTFSDLVRGKEGRDLGVIRIQFEATVLQRMVNDAMSGTGNTADPMIFDENFVRLADGRNPDRTYLPLTTLTSGHLQQLKNERRLPQNTTIEQNSGEISFATTLEKSAESTTFDFNLGGDEIMDSVAVTRVKNFPWYVVFSQDQSKLSALIKEQNNLSSSIATLIAGMISLIAMFISRLISNPVVALTETAQRISSGDLDATNKVRSKDELGILGRTLNLMAGQLKQLISGLEERVQERTRELALQNENLRFRSRQMETIAEVARGITTAQELETLLSNITHLVSERFNFYHVGIFLIDELNEYAVLRAANSEGGQRMLARQHRLKVGQVGIVGHVTSTGEARIATDVGNDAVFFNNPDLPSTRSEMALPLKIGEDIIGAVDVQSTTSNAFSKDDIQLFGILTDQIAIAIYNNRLYMETTQALREAQSLHRRYLEQEWERESEESEHPGFVFNTQGTAAVPAYETDDIRVALEKGETIQWSGDDQHTSSGLTVPVKLRGETIGLIRLQEDTKREWQPEDIDSVQAVADQVGLALENARLFSQTRRKAERERRVLEITNKIRATNDPRAMMQIAVEELQRSLKASRAQVIVQPHGSNGNGNGNGHKHEETIE